MTNWDVKIDTGRKHNGHMSIDPEQSDDELAAQFLAFVRRMREAYVEPLKGIEGVPPAVRPSKSAG